MAVSYYQPWFPAFLNYCTISMILAKLQDIYHLMTPLYYLLGHFIVGGLAMVKHYENEQMISSLTWGGLSYFYPQMFDNDDIQFYLLSFLFLDTDQEVSTSQQKDISK